MLKSNVTFFFDFKGVFAFNISWLKLFSIWFITISEESFRFSSFWLGFIIIYLSLLFLLFSLIILLLVGTGVNEFLSLLLFIWLFLSFLTIIFDLVFVSITLLINILSL